MSAIDEPRTADTPGRSRTASDTTEVTRSATSVLPWRRIAHPARGVQQRRAARGETLAGRQSVDDGDVAEGHPPDADLASREHPLVARRDQDIVAVGRLQQRVLGDHHDLAPARRE